MLTGFLSDPATFGAVISGPAGSGRRALAEAGVGMINGSTRLVRLNGSNFGTKVPLGVLSFLLAQLDATAQSTRHELIHGLGRMLCAENRPSVVLLGKPELVDEQSSSLLAQLAAMRKIRLVVICEEVHDLPGDLFALYRSNRLMHLRVHRMDSNETHAFMERELGGKASVYASATLNHLASGNRGLMRKLVNSWQEEGKLFEQEGTWVLRMSQLGSGSAMQSLHQSMTAGLGTTEHALLSALALGGPVPVERLHQSGLTAPLDGLLNGGQAKYVNDANHRVGLSNPQLGLLIRAEAHGAVPAEVRELLGRLHRDPQAAQILAELQSMGDCGDYAGQWHLAEDFAAAGYSCAGWLTDATVRVQILEIHVRTLMLNGQLPAALATIGRARSGLELAITHPDAPETLSVAHQELEILGQGSALFADELHSGLGAIGSTQSLAESSTWMHEHLHLQALAIQAAGWAAQTRQADAMKLVEHIDEQLQAMRYSNLPAGSMDEAEAADIEFQMLKAELLAGRWNRAAARAGALASGRYRVPLLIAIADMVHGILLVFSQEHDAAVHVLEPCLQQMRLEEVSTTHAVVESALAYSLACSGRRVEAQGLLDAAIAHEQAVPGPLSFYTWAGQVLAALALAELDEKPQALARLREFARRVHGEGHAVLEALTLAFILRLGGRNEAAALHAAGRRCQGFLGQSLVHLARAAGTGQGDQLAEALGVLAVNGNLLLAAPGGNDLALLLDAKAQRQLSKLANGIKRSKVPGQAPAGTPHGVDTGQQPAWVRQLTKREAQIAQLAIRGKSNLEIAKYNGVSIRTVEGHLYQVYSKLQVRNRQELTALDRSSRRSAGAR